MRRIDLRFVVGLLVGALAAGLIGWFAGRDEGEGARAGAGAEPDWTRIQETPPSAAPPGSAAPAPTESLPAAGKTECPPANRTVTDADGLHDALAQAKPGDSIMLAPGVYAGQFMTQVSGTRENPIHLCGTAASIIDGEGIKKGYAFHLNGASHWRLMGFTVRNSQKGVMADGTTFSVFQGLSIHEIGDEALHLRTFSSDNQVVGNTIWNTGKRRDKFGEGVYIGSAVSNWPRQTNGKPDKSDRNIVRGNRIRATAEAIDIKEGTTGGKVIDNVFDGSMLSGRHNDSWIDVKGNGYLIEGNVGRKTPMDGYQTHQILKGWGVDNTFRRNTAHLEGGRGVGIKLTSKPNRVTCDNKVSGGRLTNGSCS